MNTPIFQAIFTKPIPATNTKPQRIQARTTAGIRLIMSRHDPELDQYDDQHNTTPKIHAHVARKLAASLNWREDLICGTADQDGGHVFVLLPQEYSGAVSALKQISALHGNLPLDPLEKTCGPNEGASRGIKLMGAIEISRAALEPFTTGKGAE